MLGRLKRTGRKSSDEGMPDFDRDQKRTGYARRAGIITLAKLLIHHTNAKSFVSQVKAAFAPAFAFAPAMA